VALETVDAYARRTLELAGRTGARRAEALACCLLGESLLLRGQWEDAQVYLERCHDLHHALGATTGEALASQRLGELAVYRGDHAAARAHLDRALDLAIDGPLAVHLMSRIYATATLDALERDDPASARQAIEAAADARARYGACPPCDALLHPVAAEAYAALGDVRRAKEHAEAAEETRSWGSDAWNAMADVAGACASGGEDGEAAELFATAAERFERIGQPYQAARCTLQAGLALVEGGDIRSGQVWLQRALDAFQRLGAATGEARARRALERLSPIV